MHLERVARFKGIREDVLPLLWAEFARSGGALVRRGEVSGAADCWADGVKGGPGSMNPALAIWWRGAYGCYRSMRFEMRFGPPHEWWTPS
jgi:hypothetical protein